VILSNPDQALVFLAHWGLNWLQNWPTLQIFAAILLSTVPLIVVFPSCFAFTTWMERKGLARIQNRIGPNRVGIFKLRLFGLGQPLADGIKMLLKEDIVPQTADHFAHFLAPVLVVIPAFLVLALLPFNRNMVAAGVDSAVVLFFALGSASTLAIFMAGWSSRNKYSLLGGMRAIAQMVSYEIPLVLSAVTAVMISGSLSTTRIVDSQQINAWAASSNPGLQCLSQVAGWYVFTPWGFAGFIIFFIATLAEVNRSPFDLPEADSEIIAGHLTEYSGFKYALFFLAEYIGAFAMSGLACTLFLGGWHGPNIHPPGNADPEAWLIPGFIWFFVKMFALIILMIWVRGTFPRLRVDHLMGLAWKFLLPLSLLNIFVAGVYFYIPAWIGWPAGFIFLYAAYELLGRINRSNLTSRRVYRYAA
jgi:NADH-quinone oxidoreductase subunit H